MEKYKSLRLFSFENGGKQSDKMKNEYGVRYNSPASIKLPFKVKNIDSFVMYNNEMVNLISSIYQINNQINLEISDISQDIYKNYLVHFLIDEIQQSNEFENVESTRKEIEKAYDYSQKMKYARFGGMVNKYYMLLRVEKIDLLSCSDVRALYDDFVLKEVVDEDPEDCPDGVIFRKDGITVADKSLGAVHKGVSPETKIIEMMDQALNFFNNEEYDILIRVAVFHFIFGYIHPFYNGNGRMDRFISSYKLSEVINKAVCLRISYIIKENKSKYQKMFKNAEDERCMGDLTDFVIEFLELIRDACDDVKKDLFEKKNIYSDQMIKLNRIFENDLSFISEKYHRIFVCLLENDVYIGSGCYIDYIINRTGFAANTIRKVLDSAEEYVYKKKRGRKIRWYINIDKLDESPSENN